ncbi:MAG: CheA signal transduction histidine kinase, partial [Chthoniobacteraceae bacterium]|nr:CheA signal transduction histidine kinase [Chthoniobacteraceae bacterium]
MQAESKLRFTNHGVFTDESIRDFIAEAEEQLSGIEQEMLALEEERSSRSRVDEIFRHLHGLKGNTGLVLSESEKPLPRIHPLNYLQTGIHAIESAFDHLRQPAAPFVTDEEMAFLFEALDFLKEQVNAFREGELVPVRNELFLARLGLCIADFEGASTAAPDVATDVFRDAAGQSIGA